MSLKKLVRITGVLFLTFLATATFIKSSSIISAHVGGQGEVIIHMTSGGFDPKDVEVVQGETVTFENVDDKPRRPASNIHPTHRLYTGSGIEKCGTDEEERLFDSCRGLSPGESYSFTFNNPGLWRFHDHLSPSYKGSVTVIEAIDSSQLSETEETGQKDVCYQTIFGRAPQVLDSADELKGFCSKAESKYMQDCLSYIQ